MLNVCHVYSLGNRYRSCLCIIPVDIQKLRDNIQMKKNTTHIITIFSYPKLLLRIRMGI